MFAHQGAEVHRHVRVLRRTDPADHATVAGHAERHLDRLAGADAFRRRVGAVAAGQLADFLDALRAALGDHIVALLRLGR